MALKSNDKKYDELPRGGEFPPGGFFEGDLMKLNSALASAVVLGIMSGSVAMANEAKKEEHKPAAEHKGDKAACKANKAACKAEKAEKKEEAAKPAEAAPAKK